ncbi:MAG: alpha/beta hydrolase [Myxococcaceae bacterium]
MKRKRHLELQSKITASDGTGLFVRLIQQPSAVGNIPLILNDGLGCDGFAWKHFIDYFQHQHPIIHWHYRGHGHSDTPEDLNSVSIQNLAEDIGTILDHFNFKKAILCGHSMGIQVALQAFQKHPGRFEGLVLMCGSFEHPLKTWHGPQQRHQSAPLMNRAMKLGFPWVYQSVLKNKALWQPLWSILFNTDIPYQTAVMFEVNKERISKEDFSPYFEHLSTMQANVFVQMMKSYSEHSAKAILHTIDKPTLIVSGGKDTFSPHWVSLDMHHAIPNSELLYIPDGTHCTPIEHAELIHLRVEKFLCPILTQASNNSCDSITDISTLEHASRQLRRTANI